MQSGTQRQIILSLRQDGPLTVAQLSQILKITEMAVRRHLSVLERDGIIKANVRRLPIGRPSRAYLLTEAADELFPKNYCHLAVEILRDLEKVEGKAKVEAFFAHRGTRLAESYEPFLTAKTLEGQIREVANLRSRDGFLPTFLPLADGSFRLIEYNCPISKVSSEFPVACAHELNLFRKLFAAEVRREDCLATGGTSCSYVISPSEKRSG